MIGVFCFVLAVLASPFKSKLRLEAEHAVLRHQLIVLSRRVHGRVRFRFGAPLTANCSSSGLRSRSRASPSKWSSDVDLQVRDGGPFFETTLRTLPDRKSTR